MFPSCSEKCGERGEPNYSDLTQHASLISWQRRSIAVWQLNATRPSSQPSRKSATTSLDQSWSVRMYARSVTARNRLRRHLSCCGHNHRQCDDPLFIKAKRSDLVPGVADLRPTCLCSGTSSLHSNQTIFLNSARFSIPSSCPTRPTRQPLAHCLRSEQALHMTRQGVVQCSERPPSAKSFSPEVPRTLLQQGRLAKLTPLRKKNLTSSLMWTGQDDLNRNYEKHATNHENKKHCCRTGSGRTMCSRRSEKLNQSSLRAVWTKRNN